MRLHAGCVLRLFEPLQCETCSFCLRHSPCGKDCAELFMESSFKHLSPSLQQHITESQVVYWTTPFKVVDVTQLLHTSAIAGSNTTVLLRLCTRSDLSWYIARLSTGIQVSKTSFGTDIQVKHGKKSFLCI